MANKSCNYSESSEAMGVVCSEYGGNAPKGGVNQTYPTGNTTTDPDIRAMSMAKRARRGMSIEMNQERARGMSERR